MFRNVARFNREKVLAPPPTPQAGGPPLVDCPKVLLQYIRNSPPYWRKFFYLQPEGAPCRDEKKIKRVCVYIYICTGCLQMNGAVSKVNKKFNSHRTRAQRTPSAAATVQVSHALPAVRFSCLLRCRGASLKDGVAAGKGFLCAPF